MSCGTVGLMAEADRSGLPMDQPGEPASTKSISQGRQQSLTAGLSLAR